MNTELNRLMDYLAILHVDLIEGNISEHTYDLLTIATLKAIGALK